MNGGFYASDNYKNTPSSSRSICADLAENGVSITVNGKTVTKNYNYNNTSANPISRKTAVIYTSNGEKKMAYMYAKHRNDIAAKYPSYSQMIGGNDYSLDAWGEKAYYVPLSRTVLAWDATNAYLIVTDIAQTISGLKEKIAQLGLSTTNSVVLDGSGSTAMRCSEFTKKGDERHIFNMIRLIKTS
ncbi:phosphodiester glycosidase family protein [Gottfriedia solisilvae]|uniref:phosphodiester glycosidase family protein n=1 Tax=Gottfriedia solisilvae TaxID=1516104 RepID=UPI003D2ECBA8